METKLGDTGLSQSEHDAALDRYSEVQTAFQDRDGYGIEAKMDAVLRGLGFEGADFEKPTETFSGGWQMRIALAKLLLRRPRLLLLDEPTNHLDLEARNRLEEFLVDYPDAVVLVSHDRYFLDSVVTEIAEVGLRTLTEFRGTYSAHLTEREASEPQTKRANHERAYHLHGNRCAQGAVADRDVDAGGDGAGYLDGAQRGPDGGSAAPEAGKSRAGSHRVLLRGRPVRLCVAATAQAWPRTLRGDHRLAGGQMLVRGPVDVLELRVAVRMRRAFLSFARRLQPVAQAVQQPAHSGRPPDESPAPLGSAPGITPVGRRIMGCVSS